MVVLLITDGVWPGRKNAGQQTALCSGIWKGGKLPICGHFFLTLKNNCVNIKSMFRSERLIAARRLGKTVK